MTRRPRLWPVVCAVMIVAASIIAPSSATAVTATAETTSAVTASAGAIDGRILVRGDGGVLRPCADAYVGVEYPGPPGTYTGAGGDSDGNFRVENVQTPALLSVVTCSNAVVVREWHDGAEGALTRAGAAEIAPAPGEVVHTGDWVVDEASWLTVSLAFREYVGGPQRPLNADEVHITVFKLDEATGYYSIPEQFNDPDPRVAEWGGSGADRMSPALSAGTYSVLVDAVDLAIGSQYFPDARYFAQSMDLVLAPGQELDLGTMVLEPRTFDVERIAGVDRYDTAARLASTAQSGGVNSSVVYIASGQKFPDALAAAPAVITAGGAILLTAPDRLPETTRRALVSLSPRRVVVVGGPTTVSPAVVAAITAAVPGAAVDRIAGENRYATGRAIVRDAFVSAPAAYIATGAKFPDALSAGTAAGHLGLPLVLVDGARRLDADTRDLLTQLGVGEVVIAGGETTISPRLEDDLVALFGREGVVRLAGVDRYETAALINANSFWRSDFALLATGTNFPDALAAASLAGVIGAPVVLTPPQCLSDSAAMSLLTLRVAGITLVGGETTLSPDVEGLWVCG